MSHRLSLFESFGTNCEFGFVQRGLGYEESSLLRWAYVNDINALCDGIDSHFEGLFQFENLIPAGEGTMVEDVHRHIAFHSAIRSVQKDDKWEFIQTEAERRQIYQKESLKIKYLLDKFERNITRADRIYVLKHVEGLTHKDAWRVLDTIARRGEARLLYVMKAPTTALAGTVRRINSRLMLGWIDRFAPISQVQDASMACWEKILNAANQEFSSNSYHPLKLITGMANADDYKIDDMSTEWRLLSALTLFAEPGCTNRLFDADLYAERYFSATGKRLPETSEAIWHWLQEGRKLRIVPTLFFDESYYLKTQKDVQERGEFGFEHFLLHGMSEWRPPNRWFRPYEYAYHAGQGQCADYSHFLHFGIEDHILPSDAMRHLMREIAPQEHCTLELYRKIINIDLTCGFEIEPEDYKKLAFLFMPQWHITRHSSSFMNGLLDYVLEDLQNAVRPGPLFDVDIYRARAITAGLPLAGLNENPILHWLRHGFPARVVPTERFDESFYLQNNPDIAASNEWAFLHFAQHGVYEGRIGTNKHKRFLQTVSPFNPEEKSFGRQHRQWLNQDFPWREAGIDGTTPERLNRRLEAVLNSTKLREIFATAQALDPAIGEIETLSTCLLAPYYDQASYYHKALKSRLPQNNYESVICVPWIRVGGADLVAGLLARAILRVKPTEKLLVIRTDQPHFEREDWLPEAADTIHVSDLFAEMDLIQAQRLMKALLRGIQAKRVFNVNSRLCWTLMRDHGAFMAESFYNYAYLFCWDHLPSGLRAGYPTEFFANTIEHLSFCMTDTTYLRNELSRMYNLPPELQRRIKPLHTPAQSSILPVAVARQVLQQNHPEAQRRVLWGGRLDRQKRFDLVIELAQNMPDIEFWCWGSPLLDQGPDLSKLPPNITMKGNFSSFDDIPLTSAALWLFTALWEGMPTTIIELATRGVGVVASAVGGVPELITQETGWPVPEKATMSLYKQIIRSALADPQEVARRAEALQARVGLMYNNPRYDADIAAMLSKEEA